ncbi:hypothetical protein TcWFU_001116 [Taenia crassiceps]|uniref:Uncharacterized protein n=1 Tax=Taenia crassiceps TaxID=6207 RepID=A0ABR4QDA3_9CEST
MTCQKTWQTTQCAQRNALWSSWTSFSAPPPSHHFLHLIQTRKRVVDNGIVACHSTCGGHKPSHCNRADQKCAVDSSTPTAHCSLSTTQPTLPKPTPLRFHDTTSTSSPSQCTSVCTALPAHLPNTPPSSVNAHTNHNNCSQHPPPPTPCDPMQTLVEGVQERQTSASASVQPLCHHQ